LFQLGNIAVTDITKEKQLKANSLWHMIGIWVGVWFCVVQALSLCQTALSCSWQLLCLICEYLGNTYMYLIMINERLARTIWIFLMIYYKILGHYQGNTIPWKVLNLLQLEWHICLKHFSEHLKTLLTITLCNLLYTQALDLQQR